MRHCSTDLGVTKTHMKAVVSGAQYCYKLRHVKDINIRVKEIKAQGLTKCSVVK